MDFFKKTLKAIVGGIESLAIGKSTPTRVSDYRRCTPMHRQYPAKALKGCLRKTKVEVEREAGEGADEAMHAAAAPAKPEQQKGSMECEDSTSEEETEENEEKNQEKEEKKEDEGDEEKEQEERERKGWEEEEWECVEKRCSNSEKVARFAEKRSFEVARFYKEPEVGPNGEEYEEPTKQRKRRRWSISRRRESLQRLFQEAEDDVRREMEVAAKEKAAKEMEVVSDEIIDPWKAMLAQWKQSGGGAVWKAQG